MFLAGQTILRVRKGRRIKKSEGVNIGFLREIFIKRFIVLGIFVNFGLSTHLILIRRAGLGGKVQNRSCIGSGINFIR